MDNNINLNAVGRITMKVGDKVSWYSQAAGKSKYKKGEIVEIIPAGKHFENYRLCKKFNCKSAYGGGMVRGHESYAVLVPHIRNGLPTIYWPRTSSLTLVE